MRDRYHDQADDARDTLHRLQLSGGADFDTLHSDQVEALLAEADRVRYRKPRNANGSRGRYFYEMLQRRARRND